MSADGFDIRSAFLLMTAVAVVGLPVVATGAEATAPDPASATAGAVTAGSASVPAPAGDAALLARITAQAKTLTTVAGHFEQKTTSSDGDAPKVLTGTFAIEAPDKYSVVNARPGDPAWRLRSWSDGQGHWQSEKQFDGMDPDVSVHDGDAELERVLACLRGDFAVLSAEYTVSAEALPDGAAVVLTPHAQNDHDSPVRIVLDHDLHAKSVDIDQPGGQHIQLSVVDATYGAPSPAGSFTPPKL